MVEELDRLCNVQKERIKTDYYVTTHHKKDGDESQQHTGRIAHREPLILELDARRKDIVEV